MKETLKSFLREVSLFAELSDEELDVLVQVATEVEYPRNSRIIRQGDPGGSVLIVSSGEVNIILERPAADPVHLSTFGRGDFLGEMSLFDGKPRSASAVALVDSRIVEIGGEAFLTQITKTPKVALRILAEIASRVRRTDETVRELADKVYREAYSTMQSAVGSQLDSIKTIYQRTEERAAQTLDRAAQTVGHVEKLWSLLVRAVPVVGLGVLAVGFFGVKSFSDLQAKVNDVNAWHQDVGGKQQDVQRIHAQLRGAETNLRIVKESTIEIRAIREAAGLGQRVETADDLRWVALNYEQAKRRVLQRYIGTPGAGAAYEAYEPQVVLEAVDTFLDLARGARPGGELRLTSEDRREDPSAAVLGALTFVLRNLPEAREPGRSGWLEDIKLREMFPLVARAAPDRDRKAAIKELKSIVTEKPGRDRTSDNAALILAGFGEKDDATVAILMRMTEDKQRPWRAAGGAVGLARLGVGRGWQHVTQQLEGERDRGAYAAAVVLAQQGRDGLEELALKVGQPRDEAGRLAQNVKRVIGGRTPRNCFEQRYARWLVTCLDGDCQAGKAGEVIGGECTLGR